MNKILTVYKDTLNPKRWAPIFTGIVCGLHSLVYGDASLSNWRVLLPSLVVAQALPHLINAVVSRFSSLIQTKTNVDSNANLQKLYSGRPKTPWNDKPDRNAMPAIVISSDGRPLTAIENRTPDDLRPGGGINGLFFEHLVRFKQPKL